MEWIVEAETLSDFIDHGRYTISSKPLIRCRECKYRDTETGFCEGRGWPMQLVHDDGFCDKGERSEDE